MKRTKATVRIGDFGRDPAAVLARVRKSQRPVVITQHGRGLAVVMSAEAYERAETERHLLRDLLRGEREIAAGRGFDLTSVLADADEVLNGPNAV